VAQRLHGQVRRSCEVSDRQHPKRHPISLRPPPRGGSTAADGVDPATAAAPIISWTTRNRADRRARGVTMTTELTGVIAEHIAAVNAFDVDRIMATFADDAYVNDNHREIWGRDRIRQFVTRELVGDHVTMDVVEVVDHHGDVIVRARYDGTYDKTNLPEPLILSSYFGVRDGEIISLTVIHNQPSPY
jgi:hypothetical protein